MTEAYKIIATEFCKRFPHRFRTVEGVREIYRKGEIVQSPFFGIQERTKQGDWDAKDSYGCNYNFYVFTDDDCSYDTKEEGVWNAIEEFFDEIGDKKYTSRW